MWSWFGTICFHMMLLCDSVSDNCIIYLPCILNWGLSAALPAQFLQTIEQWARTQRLKTKIKENNNQWALDYVLSRTYNGQCRAEMLFPYKSILFVTPHLELTLEGVSSKYWVVASSLISFILHPQLILLTNENPQLPVCIMRPLDWQLMQLFWSVKERLHIWRLL